jgi:hypothetical protein
MAVKSKSEHKGFSPFSLDAVNFLAADVRGAVGPYLNVFLVTHQHWSQTEVGVVTTISGLLGIASKRRLALQRGISHPGRRRPRGGDRLLPTDAGNCRTENGIATEQDRLTTRPAPTTLSRK